MVSNANNLMIVCQIIFYQMDLNQLDQRLHFVMTWKLITFANPNKPGQAQLVLASSLAQCPHYLILHQNINQNQIRGVRYCWSH